MAAEQPRKKQKVGDGAIQYIKNFLSEQENEELITLLRIILEELNVGMAHTSLYFVHVTAANANSYAEFSSAKITAEFIQRQNRKRLAVPFALFFVRGYAILSDLLNKEDPKIPENMDECRSLIGLIQFLKDANEQSVFKDSKSEPEAALAIQLAQHLFMPLVPQKTFVIDSYTGLQSEGCCSAAEHPVNGAKGDTSFGCPKGWHGRVDVLGDEVPLSVVEAAVEEGDGDVVSLMSDLSEEVKKGDRFTPDSISQVLAQTIVYSFVQNKKNPVASNSLVPGIGIYSEKMVVYLYDCVEDILLTSGPVDLYADMNASNLNYRAIIILWLALNYKLFGNTTPLKYKSYTSNFHHVLGPVQLEKYKKESEQPFREEIDKEEDFFKLFNEAKETVCSQDKVSDCFPERQSISLK